MKKFFTLCALALSVTFANAQVVLNEVYTDPGNNKNEFFELYNTSTSPTPENLDNYTLVTYYEESGKSGFYILDLPNLTIASKGYFVGASANSITVQGQSGIAADYSWNTANAGAAIYKMESNGSSYTSVAVPANLNDVFVKVTGQGNTQHIFVYKNGLLINGLMGGASTTQIPAYIKTMPQLLVDMSGSSPDFTIKFSAISDNQIEYVTAVTGSDNGYFRHYDGKCGEWEKSTSQVNHTPGKTNGSAAGVLGTFTVSAIISEINGDVNNSLLSYNVTSGPVDAFPATAEVYQDLGIIGQLDAADVLVNSKQINSAAAGEQNITLPFHNDAVIIVVKSAAGCYDIVLPVENLLSPLPVHLIRFQGNLNKNNKVTLSWTVADNETVSHFEIEKSVNGKDFSTVAVLFASELKGTADYNYAETINSNEKVMFRLKMFDKGQDVDYSKILVFQTKAANTNDIKIFGNPVMDKLTFSFIADATQTVNVKVYDLAGKVVMSQKVNSQEGSNMLSLPLSSTFKPGMYVVEVNNGSDRQTAKFVKQ
jgi:hypothetical protein